MFTKTIKQGNSIMVTVPKSFNIPSGVMLDVKKVENGISLSGAFLIGGSIRFSILD